MEESNTVIIEPSPNLPSVEFVTAADINHAHELVVRCASRMISTGNEFVQKAAECGRLLVAKKSEVGHGNWYPWLAENCKLIGHETARKYMLLANRNHGCDLKGVTSIRQAVALLDDKPTNDPQEREKPPFAIRCVFNIEPEKLDEHQRKDAFDQAKPLLQAFEAYGFIEIKAA